MGLQELIQQMIDGLVAFSTDLLLPFMALTFLFGVSMRCLIWWTLRREYWFAEEFQKRVLRFINSADDDKELSFYVVTKRLLEITFYEAFEIRSIMKRRNPDAIMTWADRLFLIQQGAAKIVNDTLKQIRYIKYDREKPRFLEISKTVFQNNPCFNKVFGIIPISAFNEFLNILPNLFIVGGIFGTFLGIMKALPELGGMDLADVENSRVVMDTFLLKISFSMSTSIIGIVLSVSMTFMNTFLNAEKLFINTVEGFDNNLSILWTRCSHNTLPKNIEDFDENRDPIEVLAEDVVTRELQVETGFVHLKKPIQGWWLKDKKEQRPVLADEEKEKIIKEYERAKENKNHDLRESVNEQEEHVESDEKVA